MIVFQLGMAQSIPLLERIGNELFEKKQYLEAIEFYDKVVGIDKQNKEVKFRLGQCYDLTLQYEKAKAVFFDLASTPNHSRRAYSMYYYANQLKHESEFELADSLYAELVSYESATPELVQLAKKHQAGCQLGMRQQAIDRGFSVTVMDEGVNSKFHDFGAVVNPGSKQLIISSTRPISRSQYEGSQYDGLLPDLIAFDFEQNKWKNTTSNQSFDRLNSHWSEGSGSFAVNGTSFYFTSCRGQNGSDCSVMVSYLVNNEWSAPEKLNTYINESETENKHPFVTSQGDTLFFVSDRAGGYGQTDIWMSLRGEKKGSWTPAINLGPVINSAEEEISPYYSSAYNTLLFASNGHVGYGGYDLYAAKGVSFFQPEIYNLGPPFNTSWDDTYFHISDSVGFISSNRETGKILDIYTYPVNNERLFLSLLISGESLIDSKIVSRFKDIRALDLITFRVEDYQDYNLFEPIRYEKPKPKIILEAEAEAKTAAAPIGVKVERKLSAVDKNTLLGQHPFAINPLPTNSLKTEPLNVTAQSAENERKKITQTKYETQYFEYGLDELQAETRKSLELLVNQLSNARYSTIVLMAYADNIGSDTFNLTLSKKRGIAIQNYLVRKGIPESRIRIEALGALDPIGQDHWFCRILRRKVEIIIESDQPVSFSLANHYILRRDATAEELAHTLEIPVDSLQRDNNLVSNQLQAGQVIRVQNHSEPSDKLLLDEADIQRIFLDDQMP